MKIGSTFTDSIHGRCQVIGNTPLTLTFRDQHGRRRMRRKPEAKRWRSGCRCLVIPDAELPDETCGGVVLDIQPNGKPGRIRLTDHPVWSGAIVHRRDVFRVQAVEV